MVTGFTVRHILYRVFDATEALLYVGITNDLARRFADHAQEQPWWLDVADCRTEFFPDRVALEAAEMLAIQIEHPRHNVQHTPRDRSVRPRLACVLDGGPPADDGRGHTQVEPVILIETGAKWARLTPMLSCAACRVQHPDPNREADYVPRGFLHD